MRRPVENILRNAALPEGWSKAAKRRKFGRRMRSGGAGDASHSD
jgi:hypothetical protein